MLDEIVKILNPNDLMKKVFELARIGGFLAVDFVLRFILIINLIVGSVAICVVDASYVNVVTKIFMILTVFLLTYIARERGILSTEKRIKLLNTKSIQLATTTGIRLWKLHEWYQNLDKTTSVGNTDILGKNVEQAMQNLKNAFTPINVSNSQKLDEKEQTPSSSDDELKNKEVVEAAFETLFSVLGPKPQEPIVLPPISPMEMQNLIDEALANPQKVNQIFEEMLKRKIQ